MSKAWLTLLLCLFPFHLQALETCYANRLTFSEPHIDEIGPRTPLLGLGMDSKGRLWLGTENGEVLFDGYRSTALRYQPGSHEGLTFPISQVMNESDDYFMIHHDTLQKTLIHKGDGRIEQIKNAHKQDVAKGFEVNPVGQEPLFLHVQQPYKIGTPLRKVPQRPKHLVKDRDNLFNDPVALDIFTRFKTQYRIAALVKINNRYFAKSAFHYQSPHQSTTANEGQLYRYSLATNRLNRLASVAQFSFMDIEQYRQHLVGLIAQNNALYFVEFNDEMEVIHKVLLNAFVIGSRFHIGPNGSLWIYLATGKLYQVCDGELVSVALDTTSQPTGRAELNSAWDIYDRLWLIKPEGGLLKGQLLPSYMKLYDARNSGLPTNETRLTVPYGNNGLIVATQDKGVYLLDRESGKLLQDMTPKAGLTGWRSVYVDAQQNIWVSGYYGLWRHNRAGVWQQLDEHQSFGLIASPDKQQLLRLGYYFVDSWSLVTLADKPLFWHQELQAVRAATRLHNRWLLGTHTSFARANQLLQYLDDSGQHDVLTPNVELNRYAFVVKAYQSGFLLGSWGGGLQYLSATGQLRWQLSEKDGLPSNIIYGIEQDAQQRLWLSTDKGLAVVTRCQQDGDSACLTSVDVIDQEDGLPCSEFDSEATSQTADGDLYFGGLCGVVRVRPSLYQPESRPVTPFLANISQAGHALAGSNVFNAPYLASLPQLPGGDEINLSFASTPIGEMKRMQYRLNSGEWQQLMPPFELNLNHLSFGLTQLQYQALSEQGKAISDIQTLGLSVLTPWYASIYAQLGYMLLAVLLMMVAMQYRQRLLLQRNRELNVLVDEKTQQLANANVELHNALSEQQRMVEYLSHELRTPLTLMLLPIYQLKQQLRGKLAHLVEEAELAGQRLNHFIDQLLQLGSHEPVQQPSVYVSVNDTLTSMVRTYQPLAENKQQQLRVEFAESTALTGFWPQQSFELILSNLLSNAIKHSPVAALIEVKLAAMQQRMRLQIINHGCTIANEAQARIFEHRQRENTHVIGNGIGLHLVRYLAEQLGGSIALDVGDDWVCFTLLLPLIEAPEAVAAPASQDNGCKRSLILLVEDEVALRQQLAQLLRQEFEVAVAEDGQDAWQWLQHQLPDLIISDVQMPRMNGIGLATQLKNDPRFAHIPLLLLSAWASNSNKLAGMEAHADDYLAKPIEPALLVTKCRNLLQTLSANASFARQQLQPSSAELPQQTANNLSKSDRILQQLSALIDSAISAGNAAELSVEMLAEAVHLSSRQLNRYCEQRYQSSVSQLITLRRMHLARQLLQTTPHQVTQIAVQCGYATASHFNKVFKEMHQQTPSEYRQAFASLSEH